MRSIRDITEAHDILQAILMGEVPEVEIEGDDMAQGMATANLVALCWVLGHDSDNVQIFQRNIDGLRKCIQEAGYHMFYVPPHGEPGQNGGGGPEA